MSNKQVDVQKVVQTIRVLRDTADAFHTENETLCRENKDLRNECQKLRTGQQSSMIDNELLFDEINNLSKYVSKWRKNSITDKKIEPVKTQKQIERQKLRKNSIAESVTG